jgi:NAD+ kinase
MPSAFRHAALVGKYQTRGIRPILEEVAHFLVQRGLDVTLEQETAQNTGITDFPSLPADRLGSSCDVAVAIGGDGTMLGVARWLARQGVPLIGINQGRLGFITDISVEQFASALTPMLEGNYEEERRTMLEGGVWRDGRCIFEAFALNDVVVSRGASASMVELRVDIGGEFVANIRADGLIVASPTGSTAYSLSAGGPILHPGVASWVMVPIAPHELSNRPIVLPDDGEIRIQVVAAKEVTASFDMHSLANMLASDTVVVRRAPYQARFLHPQRWSYFATLRRKLHWNAGVREGG